MKRLLFIMIAAAITFAGCKSDDEATPNVYEDNDAPPYAASKKVWTFGDQTWSDAIHCPECNIDAFESSYTDPQCRSYTMNGKTWYYYNWAYVGANKGKLCPDPWRVPTREDFVYLRDATDLTQLGHEWNWGGLCAINPYTGQLHMGGQQDRLNLWSQSYNLGGSYPPIYPNCFIFPPIGPDPVDSDNGNVGYQVRCVKDN